jgi:hypothetical protein
MKHVIAKCGPAFTDYSWLTLAWVIVSCSNFSIFWEGHDIQCTGSWVGSSPLWICLKLLGVEPWSTSYSGLGNCMKWRLWPSGMWCHVNWWTFYPSQNQEISYNIGTCLPFYTVSQPRDSYDYIHCHENLKSRIYTKYWDVKKKKLKLCLCLTN